MKKILLALSILGLVLTIVPAILVFAGQLDIVQNKQLMMIGMLLWFGGGLRNWEK